MRTIRWGLLIVAFGIMISGCGSSSSTGGGGNTGGEQPKDKPQANTPKTPDEQVMALVAQFNALSKEEKGGPKGDKIMKDLEGIKPDGISDKTKQAVAGMATEYAMLKLGGGIKFPDGKGGFPIDPKNPGIKFDPKDFPKIPDLKFPDFPKIPDGSKLDPGIKFPDLKNLDPGIKFDPKDFPKIPELKFPDLKNIDPGIKFDPKDFPKIPELKFEERSKEPLPPPREF